jgi:ATP-dependent protease ClpP protease subunit
MKTNSDDPMIENRPLFVKENENGKEVDFYLIDEIKDVADYIDFLREVDSCRDGDFITVHINCYGGYVDVALNLYDRLRATDACVTVVIEGACCSCASMIMLAGKRWKILPHSYVMIHSWSGGLFGKYHEMESCFEYNKKYMNSHFADVYKNFLTESEISQCLQGKDFWFDSEEVVKRINKYQKEDIERSESIRKIADKYSMMAEKEINQFLKNPKKNKENSKGGSV